MDVVAIGLPEWSESTWGFAGVVLGGLLVMLGDTIADWRKAKRDDKLERRRLNAEVRVAARLIGDELDTIAENMEQLAQLGRTLERDATLNPGYLPSTEWQEHKRVLALVLDDTDTWRQFSTIYHNVGSLRARIALDGPKARIPPERLGLLTRDATTARALSERLIDVARSEDDRPDTDKT